MSPLTELLIALVAPSVHKPVGHSLVLTGRAVQQAGRKIEQFGHQVERGEFSEQVTEYVKSREARRKSHFTTV